MSEPPTPSDNELQNLANSLAAPDSTGNETQNRFHEVNGDN
jgi:hypothetical protein